MEFRKDRDGPWGSVKKDSATRQIKWLRQEYVGILQSQQGEWIQFVHDSSKMQGKGSVESENIRVDIVAEGGRCHLACYSSCLGTYFQFNFLLIYSGSSS